MMVTVLSLLQGIFPRTRPVVDCGHRRIYIYLPRDYVRRHNDESLPRMLYSRIRILDFCC
jgi:hypothetical protein